jgi:hypothetical protein
MKRSYKDTEQNLAKAGEIHIQLSSDVYTGFFAKTSDAAYKKDKV